MHLPIELDRSLDEPLQNQLYEQLRGLILVGRLKGNTRLIATRFLAEQLGISRTTVLLAYERLISEGYLETRPAVGTYVCTELPDQPPIAPPPPDPGSEFVRQATLRPPAICMPPPPASFNTKPAIDFWHGPDQSIFPLRIWQRITHQILENFGRDISQPPPPPGIDPLRAAIAEWLAIHRGIVVDAEQVIVVAGRQQAYNVIARMFLRQGDPVVVEWPGDDGASCLFDSLGARLCRVPVDEHGLMVERLPEGPAVLAHVTPCHQTPLGGTLPLERREKLIQWARKAGAYIIEDDCNGDFRYRGMGPAPLKSLDPYGLVLFAGTFSRSIGAGLRVGYLVVPPELVGPASAQKALLDNGNPWLEQMVLTEFIASGEYDRHLRRVRKTYLDRRDCLLSAVRLHFGEARLGGIDAGTHVTWFLESGQPRAPLVKTLAHSQGIGVYTVCNDDPPDGRRPPFADEALILGYSSLDEQQIRAGVAGLAQLMNGWRAAG